jgi:hypothetical protein
LFYTKRSVVILIPFWSKLGFNSLAANTATVSETVLTVAEYIPRKQAIPRVSFQIGKITIRMPADPTQVVYSRVF